MGELGQGNTKPEIKNAQVESTKIKPNEAVRPNEIAPAGGGELSPTDMLRQEAGMSVPGRIRDVKSFANGARAGAGTLDMHVPVGTPAISDLPASQQVVKRPGDPPVPINRELPPHALQAQEAARRLRQTVTAGETSTLTGPTGQGDPIQAQQTRESVRTLQQRIGAGENPTTVNPPGGETPARPGTTELPTGRQRATVTGGEQVEAPGSGGRELPEHARLAKQNAHNLQQAVTTDSLSTFGPGRGQNPPTREQAGQRETARRAIEQRQNSQNDSITSTTVGGGRTGSDTALGGGTPRTRTRAVVDGTPIVADNPPPGSVPGRPGRQGRGDQTGGTGGDTPTMPANLSPRAAERWARRNGPSETPVAGGDSGLRGRGRDGGSMEGVVPGRRGRSDFAPPADGSQLVRPGRRADMPLPPAGPGSGSDRTPGRRFDGPAVPGSPLPGRRGDAPVVPGVPVPGRRGDSPVIPGGGDRVVDTRRGGERIAQVDGRQQRWLDGQLQTMNNERLSQNFKQNFERLTPQQRDALINLDGRRQELATKILSGDSVRTTRLDQVLGTRATDLSAINPKGDVPGIDLRDPQGRRFLLDASKRIEQFKVDNLASREVPLAKILQGLDPQKISSLEKFLSGDPMIASGKLTMGQLGETRLAQLQNILSGRMDGGRPLTAAEALQQITQTMRGEGRSGLLEIGKALPEGSGLKLADLVGKSVDTRVPATGLDAGFNFTRMPMDFTTTLSPAQDNFVRNLLENSSKLANALEGTRLADGSSSFDTGTRGDLGGKLVGLSSILGTTFGDSRGDFAVRGDATALSVIARSLGQVDGGAGSVILDAGGDAAATTADTASQAGKIHEFVARMPIDPVTGLPYDPSSGKLLDPTTGRAIGDKSAESKKDQADGDEMEEKEERKKKRQEKEEDSDKAKHKAMLLLLQARKKREQELRDKALKDQKRKEEEEKRVKYICKEGDTIQSIALKQLRDSRIAPLIYQINKDVIPTQVVNGEQAPILHAGLVIWLPSPKETREFRAKLLSGPQAAKPPQEGQFQSAEDELSARFGENWSGSPQETSGQDSMESKLMASAMEEARRRRENIEKALGPITPKTTAHRTSSERTTYVVRLGNTLKSVAINHPLLGDVSLWRLLAEVNGLSTDTDAKGQPKAGIVRGKSIVIPSAEEIRDFRQSLGPSQPTFRQESRVSKTCQNCGRMNVASATLCPGCGHEFDAVRTQTDPPTTQEEPETPKDRDAASIVLEAAGYKGARTENLDETGEPEVESTVNLDQQTPFFEAPAQARPQPMSPIAVSEPLWAAIKNFEDNCRLVKSCETWEGANGKLIIQLQLMEDNWFPILEYEVYSSHSVRHSYVRQTRQKKTVKIDLPAVAALELAQNDLIANWNSYRQKYHS